MLNILVSFLVSGSVLHTLPPTVTMTKNIISLVLAMTPFVTFAFAKGLVRVKINIPF